MFVPECNKFIHYKRLEFLKQYYFPEHNDQDKSASSSVTNKSPPIRKIFVGNLSGRVSNNVIYFLSFEVTVLM
jgi:hypothetical protein